MKVDIFDFDLDRSLIADKPASPRDSSKLLDLSEEDRITDRVFYELPEILHEGDVLVFNDTKVIPARLYGKRGKAQVEVTLYHPVDGIRWQSFIKNAKRLRPGDTVAFYTAEIPAEKSDFTAEVLEKNGEDGILLKFDCDPKNLGHYLEKYGSMPLPPYIKPPMACGTNITTKKIIRPSMPDTRVPLPRRPPACILPRASWRLWIKKASKRFS